MKLSIKWLDDYIKTDMPPREFSEAMTLSGSKVEGYERQGDDIKNVVAGKILSVEPHPDADRLCVCKVDVGEQEPLQIVTGATNVFAGAVVPVALSGSTLPGGVKIKKGKLRGVESNGMMCSLGELTLTKNDFPYAIEDGIFIMREPCKPGDDICEVLGLSDTVFEFEITPNRPDCLSILGLAREAAVTFAKPLTIKTPEAKGSPAAGKTADLLTVEVLDKELCPRYTARAVKNVKIAPSPRWMRERLRSMGVRPINNLVDITNFVMLEYGQPMHAFDARMIHGGKIVVRRAGEGEKITTLDGAERSLTPEMLVIADAEKPVALAGIMGGENSEIRDDTETVIFESAVFKGASIRKTSRKTGLRTEASARYEKGLDPAGTRTVLERACELVELLGAGEVCEDIVDADNSGKTPVKVKLEADWINRFLGTEIPAAQMAAILEKLGFSVEADIVTVPSFRADVRHKADLAEEIARIYGYDKIGTTLIDAPATQGGLNDEQKFENRVDAVLLGCGYSEISTYSFVSPKAYDKIRMPEDSALRKSVRLLNPLGEDTGIMRTTALPSLLDILAKNYSNRNVHAALYEIATVYLPQSGNELPDERKKITLGAYGEKSGFFELKGTVENLLAEAGVADASFEAVSAEPAFHPGRCALVSAGGKTLGVFGEIHPQVLENYGIGEKACAGVFDFQTLFSLRRAEINYRPLPKFPSSERDIAVLCDETLTAAALEKAIASACPNLLERITLFDVYRGSQIPEGKKSVAFAVSLRAADRTLTDKETDAAMEKILKSLRAAGAELRA